MTLADLKRKTLRHLEGARVPAVDLLDAINTARRDVWREIGGPVSDTLTLDLVGGQRDYPLDAIPVHAILSVSWRAGAAERPNRLKPMTPRQLLDAVETYPQALTGAPRAWTLRPVTYRAGSSMGGFPEPGRYAGPGVSLYPIPDGTVAGGLLLEVAGAAADLALDTDTSALTPEADEAACWLAAARLADDYSDDPTLAAKANRLEKRADIATEAARNALYDMDGGCGEFFNPDGFGDTPGLGTAGGTVLTSVTVAPTPAVTTPVRRQTSATATSANGATEITIPLTEAVASDSTGGVMVFSDEQMFIRLYEVAPDRLSITARLRAGATFYGEDVVAYYQTG